MFCKFVSKGKSGGVVMSNVYTPTHVVYRYVYYTHMRNVTRYVMKPCQCVSLKKFISLYYIFPHTCLILGCLFEIICIQW